MTLPSGEQILSTLERRATLLLYALVISASIMWTAIGFWKYAHFRYDALDLGIYSQVIWNTSEGRLLQMSIHPQSYLGDHFELYILPIALIYKIWSDPRLLLILQAVIINAAAIPFFYLARNFFRDKRTTAFPSAMALLIAYAYILNPYVGNAIIFEFHIMPLFILPFALALMYAERGKYGPSMGWLFAALLIREDAASIVALSGLAIWFLFPRPRQQPAWKGALPPFIISVLWLCFTAYAISIF